MCGRKRWWSRRKARRRSARPARPTRSDRNGTRDGGATMSPRPLFARRSIDLLDALGRHDLVAVLFRGLELGGSLLSRRRAAVDERVALELVQPLLRLPLVRPRGEQVVD